MINQDLYYVGVNDHEIDLFEGQFVVPNGMAYNSYVLVDEKIAVMDAVDGRFSSEWLENIERVLAGKTPDYLIIQHMEPDHSSGIVSFTDKYPGALIVSSAMAFSMMKNYFGTDFSTRRIVIKEADTLSLGKHNLTFIGAPMIHWPEVMMTYDDYNHVLFSADAFGKFGALDQEEEWACEARRYYFGIVGKYGVQVQNLLKKATALDIQMICSLHGPVLRENLDYYLKLYQTWSSYQPEDEGILIAYTSVYGNTRKAVLALEEMLKEKGQRVVVTDLARSDWAENVEDAFRYSKLVLATTTYNAGIFPFMREFIHHLTERGYSNRFVALIENGSWAPNAANGMKKMFEQSKNITFAKTAVKILAAMNEENKAQLECLAEELSK